MDELVLRESIISHARRMHADRLTVANSGNISARFGDGFLVTPSGIPYEFLVPGQIVKLDLQGNVEGLSPRPSSEWRIHKDIYLAMPEVSAIVHAHSPAATALSAFRRPVPSFHYMVALMGGDEIPCAGYATFGTQALSDRVLEALEGYSGCLMANHGMIATGKDLEDAYKRALVLEDLCARYREACSLGSPHLLTRAEMQEAREAFAVYGQRGEKS